MVAKSSILANLQMLNRSYRKAASLKRAQFYSKLALLELCGWIEESMDDVILRCAIRHLKESRNRDYCAKEIVRRTYGFDYERNFRFMLIGLLGLVNIEKLERQVNPQVYSKMTAALSNLKKQRDAEAHTHLKGTTRTINSPSISLSYFQDVYAGLFEFDRIIRSTKWFV
jgi:hypothetical protein